MQASGEKNEKVPSLKKNNKINKKRFSDVCGTSSLGMESTNNIAKLLKMCVSKNA